MPASNLRLEEIALFNYIKYELLPTEFSEQIQNETLTYSSSLGAYITSSSMDPSPTSVGRGWVVFDDSTVNGSIIVDTSQEQTSKISVTGASSYTVDYLNGRIYNPDTAPSSIDYYWNYVSVIDSWPSVSPPPTPIVSVDLNFSRKEGFQLGGGKKNVRTLDLHIFATNRAERSDITEFLHNAFFDKSVTIKDFSSGSYLLHDGTYNSGFTPSVLSSSPMQFISVEARNINVWSDWSELNKYRSVIRCEYETYEDPS